MAGTTGTTVEPLWADLERQLIPTFTRYRERIAELPVSVKPDRTLLTEADIAVQQLICEAIRSREPDAVIIAEEDERTAARHDVATSDGRVWVIDPIDGTAQFVRAGEREFCSVVCLLEDWQPVAAFVLAPEIGPERTPVTLITEATARSVRANGADVSAAAERSATRELSLTRSSGAPERAADVIARQTGYTLKTRTTSQTLDMLRTAVDLSSLTDLPMASFDLFCRRDQKVWDGLAGLCFGAATGLGSCTEDGSALPLGPSLLSQAEPIFPSTVMGRPETVSWFVDASAPRP